MGEVRAMSDPGWQPSGQAQPEGGNPPGAAFPAPTSGGGTTALQSDNNYPVTCALDAPLEMTNFQPLINYLLAIPHILLVGLYGIVAFVYAIVAWFSIVLNGSPPENARDNIAAFQRYYYRVVIFQYFLTHKYPEFKTVPGEADPGGFPARIDITFATSYDKMQVLLRILYIIPLYLYGIYVAIMLWIGLLIGFFSVLTGGRWNPQWRRTVFNALTWIMRVNCWYFLLVDEYPGFTFQA
jgi:Domain of unknown function (DUF4389)